jgi:hypothetical protein
VSGTEYDRLEDESTPAKKMYRVPGIRLVIVVSMEVADFRKYAI